MYLTQQQTWACLIVDVGYTGCLPCIYQSLLLCSDFERLIIAMTHYLHQVRKRKEPLEEYLGEIMDFVYRKAGVLQEAGLKDDDGA